MIITSKFQLILKLDEKYKSDYLAGKLLKRKYLACRIFLALEAKKIMLSSESKDRVFFFINKGEIDGGDPLKQLEELFTNIN
jgi:hypothetical protein